MKIRISGQILQFRLSAQNLDDLEKRRRLELQIQVTSAMSLNFALIIGESDGTASEVGLVTSVDRIELTLPGEQFEAWNRSYEIEWELRPANSSLTFLVEKDLKDQRTSRGAQSSPSGSTGESRRDPNR